MACCEDGQLMAHLDGQLAPREHRWLNGHLKACARCQQALARLAGEREGVTRLLGCYHLAALNLPVSRPPSWSALADRTSTAKGAVRWMRRYYKWIAAAAVVGLFFSYAPARSLAAQFLRVFRVERVKVLYFDPADIARLREALYSQQEVDIDKFGRVETEPLSEPLRVPRARLPATIGDYALDGAHSQPGGVVKVTPNVEGINQFLRRLGTTTLLPPALDGRTFKITMPEIVHARYQNRETGRGLGVYQGVPPTLEVPEGVDVLAVRQALLDLPILPWDLKRALEGVNDWTRTLPVPAFAGQTEEITLDGAPGFFIQGREFNPPGDRAVTGGDPGTYHGPSLLAWYRDGLWTMLEGRTDMTREEAFRLARELEAAHGR